MVVFEMESYYVVLSGLKLDLSASAKITGVLHYTRFKKYI
jgi:hypothetical protein